MAILNNFYFSQLPDVWVRMGPAKGADQPYVLAKNIFRNVALVNNLQKEFLVFTPIQIGEGEKPYQIAYEYYGDAAYEWVILLCNNITDVYDQWPLSSSELFNLVQKKYPLDELNEIHHYETISIKTHNGIEILEGGLIVNHDFTYRHPTTGVILSGDAVRTAITNYEYMVSENEKKREIYLLKKQYLSQFISEFEKLVAYDKRKDEYEDVPLTPTSIAENYIK
jgi:hypothetical protein